VESSTSAPTIQSVSSAAAPSTPAALEKVSVLISISDQLASTRHSSMSFSPRLVSTITSISVGTPVLERDFLSWVAVPLILVSVVFVLKET
jgi:flagellar biosynthesis protein FliQ